jgi:IS30 family transposase
MKKTFKHLGILDRDRFKSLWDDGCNQTEIAKILKVHKSTISRELQRRRETGEYDSDTAQHKATVLRSNSKHQGMKIEQHPEEKAKLIDMITTLRSPDEIAHESKEWKVSFSTPTIYKWLYSAFGQQYCKYLCTKRWKKRKQNKNKTERVMIPNKLSIHGRD